MSLTLTKNNDFKPMPAGTHSARCYQIIDIGTQKTEYQGEVKFLSKIILSFETPDEKMEDGKPFIIHQEYTASMGEKANLRQHLESWRGRQFTPEELTGFDVSRLLDQPCVITVIHKTSGSGNTYAKITGISKPMKGMEVPAVTNTLLKWEMGDDMTPLPDWIQKKVLASRELNYGAESAPTGGYDERNPPPTGNNSGYNEANPPPHGSLAGDFDDDIPF